METIKNEILNIIQNFTTEFGREYKENNFFSIDSNSDYFSSFSSLDEIWNIKLIEPKKPNNINQRKLVELNDKIYKYYEHLLKKYDYSSTNRSEFDEMISKIFLLLCNIYDLFSNFLEIYFKNDWLNLHLKLMNACLDLNQTPEPGLGSNGKEKIEVLNHFLLFFSLCLSNDKDFNTRLFLIIKHPDLFYKIAIISADISYFCCCGHGMRCGSDNANANIKSILLVFETFKYMEDNNINYDSAKKAKIQIVEFFFPNIGKNPCIVYLYKMVKMLNSDKIFEHILNNTNLISEAFKKEDDACFGHAIDGFEALINLCKDPDLLFKILNIITPPEKGVKNRVYREILKKISELITNNNSVEYLENKLYNDNNFGKILETLKLDTYLGDYEGIWQILLEINNSNIVTIFYRMKNKYNIGHIMKDQVDNLVKQNLTRYRLNGVVRIMNLFLKMGSEIKKKYNCDNYYLEQFRDCYKIISNLSIENDEDVDEFKNYYKSS